MANNFGRIPSLVGNAGVGSIGNSSLMNRATNRVSTFLSSTANLLMVGLGLVLIVFVFLVLYNRTLGDKVRSGWEQIKTILRNKGIIEVDVGPGAVTATLTPEPTIILPPLTATLLPEPVTVPKAADEPPNDGMHVPTEDRPAGMPRATESIPSLSSISSSLFDQNKEDKETGRKHGSIFAGDEVFNVSRNIYTFNDAAAVCAAAGAELATYDQVKEAHEKGADWCNYGWIKGQMAVYPTQKSTWEKLQKGSPEFRNACGQPGVNGGYFDNPELRFGVNCYGKKPGKKASDEILDSQVALPQSPAELEFEKQVQRFRDQMDAATILPFHKGQWNE